MSRAYTTDEVRQRFLEHVWVMVNYWDSEGRVSEYGKLTGLMHSILAAIDGSAGDLPAFVLAADPHPDDRQFHEDEGEDYYAEASVENSISGGLHELFFEVGRSTGLYRENKEAMEGKP